MKHIFLRFICIAILILFQMSFLGIIFPRLDVPVLPLLAIVAWTLALGFPRSLRITVPLTVFFDVISSGSVTFFSLYGVILAYTASFLSRRLLIEGGGLGAIITCFFATGGVLAYQALGWLGSSMISQEPPLTLFSPVGGQTLAHFGLTLVLSLLFFPILSAMIRIFEERLRLSSQTYSIK